jgi:(p)ppGpp synthase/HD superfamily hydrolase
MSPSDPEPPQLTDRFEAALIMATQLHAGQLRKGTRVPYLSHLLGVTALVLEDGGGEDEAIAALLHDAVEDQGGMQTLDEIRRRFGDHVAEIVDALSDAYTTPKPPWRQRKMDYLAHLPAASKEVRRVSLADKLHNARAILRTLRQEGERTWERFNGGKAGTLWYYRGLLKVFQETGSDFMTAELGRVLGEIERIAGSQERED